MSIQLKIEPVRTYQHNVDKCGRLPNFSHDDTRSCPSRTANAQARLGSVVEHQHQGTADTAERVSNEPLVEAGGNALLRGDLLQAISSALVDVLLNWLFCLHLETPADSVEGIADTGAQMMAVCAAANVEAK